MEERRDRSESAGGINLVVTAPARTSNELSHSDNAGLAQTSPSNTRENQVKQSQAQPDAGKSFMAAKLGKLGKKIGLEEPYWLNMDMNNIGAAREYPTVPGEMGTNADLIVQQDLYRTGDRDGPRSPGFRPRASSFASTRSSVECSPSQRVRSGTGQNLDHSQSASAASAAFGNRRDTSQSLEVPRFGNRRSASLPPT